MKRVKSYFDYQVLKAIYKTVIIVSVSDSDALIFIKKQKKKIHRVS